MARDLPLLELASARAWRAWLARNHATSHGVWLVFHKVHTGVPSLSYLTSLDEALCFGWIDSLIKRLDDDRFVRKFTPRTPTSKWSDVNRKRWAELKAADRLTAAGLAAAPTDNSYAPKPKIPILPAYIASAFKTNAKAWRFFQSLPPRERRTFVWWIYTAKREGTRAKRLAESIAMLAAGRRLGLK
jgi:uncharacterized protein YdeI (YjbR/CyaY-like superfamily)